MPETRAPLLTKVCPWEVDDVVLEGALEREVVGHRF